MNETTKLLLASCPPKYTIAFPSKSYPHNTLEMMFKRAIILSLAAALINDLVIAEDVGPPFASAKTSKSSSKSVKDDVYVPMVEESTAPKAFKGGKSSKADMSLGGDMSVAKAFKNGKSAKIVDGKFIVLLFRALICNGYVFLSLAVGSCVYQGCKAGQGDVCQ